MSAEVSVELHFEEITQEIHDKINSIVANNTTKMSIAAQRNVSGPSPSHLEVDTGHLMNTLQEGTQVISDESSITGEVSTDARSFKGFPYAQYWEGVVDQGNGKHSPWPRPFASPALESVKDEFIQEMESLI